MLDEPRRHRFFMLVLGLTALGTAPLPFAGRDTVLFLGVPLWLWWSFSFTAALSLVTAWGILRLWRGEDDPGSEPPAGRTPGGRTPGGRTPGGRTPG